jgi:hypothetical protein
MASPKLDFLFHVLYHEIEKPINHTVFVRPMRNETPFSCSDRISLQEKKRRKTTEKKTKKKERKGEKKEGEGVSSPFEGSHEANAVLLRKIGLEFRLERPPLCKIAFRKIGLGFLRFVPRNLIG